MFFDGMFVHVRVFLTPTLEHHVVWVCTDEGDLKELTRSEKPLTPGTEDFMVLDSDDLHIHDGPGGGQISVRSADLNIEFHSTRDFAWRPAGTLAGARHCSSSFCAGWPLLNCRVLRCVQVSLPMMKLSSTGHS